VLKSADSGLGLITRRSCVQIAPPLLFTNHSSQSYGFPLTRRSWRLIIAWLRVVFLKKIASLKPNVGGHCYKEMRKKYYCGYLWFCRDVNSMLLSGNHLAYNCRDCVGDYLYTLQSGWVKSQQETRAYSFSHIVKIEKKSELSN